MTVEPHAERHERKSRRQGEDAVARLAATTENLAQQEQEQEREQERRRLWSVADIADRQVERGEPINEEGWTLVEYAFLCGVWRDLYYQSFHWRKTSKLQRVTVPFCERCGSRERRHLVAHHGNYDRPGAERVKVDLETLCSDCHNAHHGGRIPVDWTLDGLRD